jgi:hypothetical protein
MRVLRRRHTLGIVALFALAMQAVLALAHTHSHTYARAGADDLAKRAITYGLCRADARRSCPAPAPHDDHSKCPLCWSMSLASTGVLSAPPAITLIKARIELAPPIRTAVRAQGNWIVHFQARAPPSA